MTGVLHPVGPEPASTYWLRRALVVGVVAVLFAVVAALIPNGSSSQLAVPAAPGSAAPATAATTSAAVTSAPATPSTSPTKTPTTPDKADSSAGPSAPSKARATSKAKAASKPKAKATPARPAPLLCDPGTLRPTLTGLPRLRVKKATVFNLSLINGSGTTCRVSVNAENFELKIYSGKDRIWSTGDCSTAVRSVNRDVASQRAAVWRMKWNGLRSVAGCKSAAEIPKPGTYVVTAQHSGAKPVKMRMILTG